MNKLLPLLMLPLILLSSSALAAPPTFSVAFSPTTISPGSVSTMTYTIDNSAGTTPVGSMTFSNTFPAGMTVATPANGSTSCINGFFTATAGSNNVTFNDYRLALGGTCTFSLDVTSVTAGSNVNTTGALSTSEGSSGTANATLTVDTGRAGFSMAFSPSTIAPGGVSNLIYTIDNSANGSNADLLLFFNTLPDGVVVSDFPAAATTCTGGAGTPLITTTAGGSTIEFEKGFVATTASCTVSVNVTAAATGSYVNTSGALSQNGSNSSGVASATLNVVDPFLNLSFPTSSSPNEAVQLTFTINNLDRSNAATDITFTNDLNATLSGLTATVLPANDFCGKGSALTGTSTLTIVGANLAAEASCTFAVTVQIPANAAAGSYTNTTSTINLTRGSPTTEAAVSNTLVVQAAPSITATFIDDPVNSGQNVTLRYVITNTDSVNAASAITFTQIIDEVYPGLTVNNLPAANSCGIGSTFTETIPIAFTVFTMSDGLLAAGANCTFDLILTTPPDSAPATSVHSTSLISATVAGNTVFGTAASDNLIVYSAPELSIAITEEYAAPDSTITAQFTLDYGVNAVADATGVNFTVALNTALATTITTQNDICGSGSSFSGTTVSSVTTLSLAGATLSPGGSCTFSVSLSVSDTAIPGVITVISSAIDAMTSGLSVDSIAVSDSVTITGITFSKTLTTSPTLPGGLVTMEYTISNATTAGEATDIQFTDKFNEALSSWQAIALPTFPCGPTSTLSGTTSMTLNNGKLTPGETCVFSVITQIPAGAASGQYATATSEISATVGGNNTTNPAAETVLTVASLTLDVTTTAANPTSTSPIPFSFIFSRPVINFVVADLTVTNGTAINFAGSGDTYTVDITPDGDGTVTVSVAASVADDSVDNSVKNPAASLSISYIANPTVPTPSLVIGAPSSTLASSGPVTYTVTYTNADEVNLTPSSITLNNTGTSATVTVTNSTTNTPTVNLSNISGNGTLGFSIAAGTARNGDALAPAAGPSSTFSVDNIAPTLTITDTVADPINVPFTATFTFSEDVVGFAQADITVVNASLSNFTAVSGTVYTATVTPTAQSTVTLDVAAAAARDSANLSNIAATQYSIAHDSVAPTLTITGPAGPLNTTFTANFNFTEDVTGFALADISVGNGTPSNFTTISAQSYSVLVTPDGEGTVTVNVPASAVIDSATNTNSAATPFSLTYDVTQPTVVISGPSGPVNAPFTATFTFSEDVSGSIQSAITAVNATVGNFNVVSNSVFTATVTPTADATVTLDFAAGQASDSASNTNLVASQYSVDHDGTPPTVTIAAVTGTVNTAVTATITFSEAISGFTESDISVTNATLSSFTPVSSTVYTVVVTPVANGTVTLDIPASAAIDTANNGNVAASQYSVIYDISALIATLTSTVADPTNAGFDLAVDFNKTVTGLEITDFTLVNATIAAPVGSGSSYTISVTPTNDGTVSVTLNSASVVDSASNTNGISNTFTVQYDQSIPILQSLIPAHQSVDVATSGTLTLTFNETMVAGSSNNLIEVKNFTTNVVETSFAADNAAVSISGSTVTITLGQDLSELTQFYVTIGSNAFIDTAGNVYSGFSDNATWRFDTISNPPAAVADTARVDEDNQLLINVINNDDGQNSALLPASLSIQTAPANGKTSINTATGSITYQPNGDFNGTDTFEYTISDMLSTFSNPTTVTVTVNPVNDLPQANNDTATTVQNSPVTISPLSNDSDADGNNQINTATLVVTTQPQHGQLDIINDQFVYQPTLNFSGSDTFNYSVSDVDAGISNIATVSINVVGSNSTPTAVADSFTLAEDTATSLNVLTNDSDSDGQLQADSVVIIAEPSDGAVTINSDGTLTYTPSSDFFGSDSLSYTVKDDGGATSAPAVVNLTITSVNDAPRTTVDSINMVDLTSTHSLNVIGNDQDIDGSISSIAITSQPQNGSISINSTSLLLLYTPVSNFPGTDSFSYQLTDNEGLTSSVTTVSLGQTAVNEPPLANEDRIQTDEDQFVIIDVLANDSDLDGLLIKTSMLITTAPLHGSASIRQSDGTIFYQPTAHFSGTDSLIYQVSDDKGASTSATVKIQINSINDLPVAVSQTLSVNEDNALAIILTGGDFDADPLAYMLDRHPANGQLTGVPPNLSYQANENFNGSDNFTFWVNDGSEDSAVATISITVVAQNDTPVADLQTLTLNEDQSLNIGLSGSDIDNDTLTYRVTNNPVNGQLTGQLPNLIYSPNANYNGSDNFTFVVNDGTLDSAEATISLTIVAQNDAPIADAQSLTLLEDNQLDIVLTGSDNDSATLSYLIVDSPSSGQLVGNAPNLRYVPNTDFNGTDQFSFKINDELVDSNTVIVSLTITAQNDAPIADARTIDVPEDLSFPITLSGHDLDGDSITFATLTNPVNGTLSGLAPNLIYTPQSNFNGEDSFTFQASDASLSSAPATINISVTPVNDPPVAVDDTFAHDSSLPVTIDPLVNDTDIDGDTLSIIGASASIGSVSFSDSQITYSPVDGFIGSAVIEYTVSDGQGSTDNALVMVDISAAGGSGGNLATITVPGDIDIDADGLLTTVNPGIASATDRFGKRLKVSRVNPDNHFKPGVNTVLWQVSNAKNLTIQASQLVRVKPLISLDNNQITREGASVTIGVHLNGPSPSYPLSIPYTVGGTADARSEGEGEGKSKGDHNLTDGEIIIESGITGVIHFNVFADDLSEGEETITISLNDDINRGNQATHTVTISEENIAPKVSLTVTQAEQQNRVVNRKSGLVVVNAKARHPNPDKQYHYQWSNREELLNDLDETATSYSFDPAELPLGLYHLQLTALDNDDSQYQASHEIVIKVEAAAVKLSSQDSDGDGIADNIEGSADTDNDGIANYLDAIPACNVMSGSLNTSNRFLIEGQPGICLQLGENALNQATASPRITVISNNNLVSQLFDFTADQLPITGHSYQIVLPQNQAIATNAIYRIQHRSGESADFVENADNRLMSTAGEPGYCPPPGDSRWQSGLTAGHWCVQLQLNDGGPNDIDAAANRVIMAPGGLSISPANEE